MMEERTKTSLGSTLARLCRAGVAAVTPPRVRTCLDVVSQVSHHAHPMPVLRAFRYCIAVLPAALRRASCLMSGVALAPRRRSPVIVA
jgi:hypothetical protein